MLAYLQALVRLNWSGVDLFFVLSGFLIAGILIDNRDASNYLRAFYLRRVCRILPLYYLCLIAFIIARFCSQGAGSGHNWLFQNQGIGGTGMGELNRIPLWSYALYLQNWWMAKTGTWGPGGLGITWSLAVEEQFYLLLPIVVLLVRPKWIGVTSAAAIVFATLFRFAMTGLGAYCLLPSRLDALMAGVLIAWLLRYYAVVVFISKHVNLITLSLACCTIFVCILIARPRIIGTLHHSFLALFYALILVIAIVFPSHWLSQIFQSKSLRSIGRISYGIYLLHMGFTGAAYILIVKHSPLILTARDAIVSLGAILGAIGAAYISYEFMERRLIAFGQRYKYMKTAGPANL
jgi:peptidoglycan/LPS O-acetylase OafA/YrhL